MMEGPKTIFTSFSFVIETLMMQLNCVITEKYELKLRDE